MERGEITCVNKIVIEKDEVSKQIKITVEGEWNGKERVRIGRALIREIRKQKYKNLLLHKQADLKTEGEENKKPAFEQKRLDNLAKARAVKKEKKLKEEEQNDVRGQTKQ